MVPRILRINLFQFRGGIVDLAHLVINKRKIQSGSGQLGRLLESNLVFRKSLFETAQSSQSCAQVGMNGGRLGMQLEELLDIPWTAPSRSPGLLLLHGVLHQLLRAHWGLQLCRRSH